MCRAKYSVFLHEVIRNSRDSKHHGGKRKLHAVVNFKVLVGLKIIKNCKKFFLAILKALSFLLQMDPVWTMVGS